VEAILIFLVYNQMEDKLFLTSVSGFDEEIKKRYSTLFYGMGDTHVKTDVKTLKHQKSEYSLSVGKHSVTVSYNKRAISLS
jgi:hypothetical protein